MFAIFNIYALACLALGRVSLGFGLGRMTGKRARIAAAILLMNIPLQIFCNMGFAFYFQMNPNPSPSAEGVARVVSTILPIIIAYAGAVSYGKKTQANASQNQFRQIFE